MQLDLNHFVSDVDTDAMQKNEVSTVTVGLKQSLLLRCQIKAFYGPFPKWKKDGKATMSQCSSTVNEVSRFLKNIFLGLHSRKKGN